MTAIVIVLAFLMMVVYFVLGGRASRAEHPGGSTFPLKSSSNSNRFGRSFLAGFIAVSALVQLSASESPTFGSPAEVGVAVGIFALVVALLGSLPGVSIGADLLYSVIGLIALVPAMSELTEPSICGIDTNVPLRISAVALFVAIAFLSAACGFVIGGMNINGAAVAGLAWFGAIDVVLFLTSPVGVTSGSTPLALGIIAAVILGSTIGARPETGLLIVGTALGLIVLLSSASGMSTNCDEVDSVGSLTVFATYAVVFGIGRWTIGKFMPDRVG